MQQEMKLGLMGELTRLGFGEEKEVYCAGYWLRVAAGGVGGYYAIDCWGASTPEEGKQEGGKDLR